MIDKDVNYNDEQFLIKYFLDMHPFIKNDEIKNYNEITNQDLYIEYKDGKRFMYHQPENFLRPILYYNENMTEEDMKKEFSYRLRMYMNRRFISQKELAEKIRTTQPMISRYLSGKVLPSTYMLDKLSKVLHYPVESFYATKITYL